MPCAPVLDRRKLGEGPQIAHNDIIGIYEDPTLGQVRQARPVARFDRTPAEPALMAPFLGADNETLLDELGYSAREITRLKAEGVLGAHPPKT